MQIIKKFDIGKPICLAMSVTCAATEAATQTTMTTKTVTANANIKTRFYTQMTEKS